VYRSSSTTGARYHAEYVTRTNGQVSEYPFFNARLTLTEVEARLLTDYHVSYLLADPEHADGIALKLKTATSGRP